MVAKHTDLPARAGHDPPFVAGFMFSWRVGIRPPVASIPSEIQDVNVSQAGGLFPFPLSAPQRDHGTGGHEVKLPWCQVITLEAQRRVHVVGRSHERMTAVVRSILRSCTAS